MNSLAEKTLTAAQLDMAAADLRNAGLVVQTAGMNKRAMVNPEDGSVCALGAIELATTKRLVKYARDGFWGVGIGRDADATFYRYHNAVALLAEFLPVELCRMCGGEGACQESCCANGVREVYDVVTHYNDSHCVSGDVLIALLGNAADRGNLAAAEKRHLLTGDRIPVLV